MDLKYILIMDSKAVVVKMDIAVTTFVFESYKYIYIYNIQYLILRKILAFILKYPQLCDSLNRLIFSVGVIECLENNL